MSTKRIKARLVTPFDEVLDYWELPADAESYEQMVRQMTRPWMRGNYMTTTEMIKASLRAIGIVPPRTGKGQK